MTIVRLEKDFVELSSVVNGTTHWVAYINSINDRIRIVNELDPELVARILEVWGDEPCCIDEEITQPSIKTRGTWEHTLETVPGTGVASIITPDVCHFEIMGDLVYIFNTDVITYRLHRGSGSNFTCQQLILHGLPYEGKGKVNAFLWTGLTNYSTRSCMVQGKSVILNLSTGMSVSNTNLDVSLSFNGIYQKL